MKRYTKSVYQWSDRYSRYISFLFKNPKEDFFGFYKTHLGSPTIDYNLEVAQSEKTLVLEMLL
jgi:hypothetical protein